MSLNPILRSLNERDADDFNTEFCMVTPEQVDALLGRQPGGRCCEPERALMRAVLQDAVLCLIGEAAGTTKAERPRIALEARAWLHSRTGVFSFENVCLVLGLNPEGLRGRLLELAAREARTPSASQGDEDGARAAGHGVRQLRKARERRGRSIRLRADHRRRAGGA